MCVHGSPKRVDKWISIQYGETVSYNKPKSDYVYITSPLLTNDDKTSNSTKRTKNFLPLFFYWEVDYQITSTLNSKVPINLFVESFTNYAKSKNLKDKLNGQKLEITINRIPTSFSLNYDFRAIFLILAQIHWEKIYMMPDSKELSITYKVLKDNMEIKKGEISIPDLNKNKNKSFFKRIKTATTDYMSQYDENIKTIARSAVDKIIVEL